MRNVKTVAVVLMLAVIFMLSAATSVMAKGHGKCCGGYKKGLDDKIAYKAKFMLINEKDLGLTEDQVEKIEEIKYDVKRNMVETKADIKLVKIDIYEKLYEDKVDVDAIDPLIERKYELKKAKDKYLVRRYADLKDVLSPEQYERMKELWYEQKKMCRK